ncbi:MAG: cupin domain-containing protein [Pseudomonadota bacterium]
MADQFDHLIARSGADEEQWTDERCFIREILNDPRVPEVSLAEARVEPGVTTEWHRVAVREWYLIRSGVGRMEVGDSEPFPVAPGDTVVIPAGTPQRITNTGDEDLRFQCLCTPRFRPEIYTAINQLS